MLCREKGARPEDGIWVKYWYQPVQNSTGFKLYQPKNIFSGSLKTIAEGVSAGLSSIKRAFHLTYPNLFVFSIHQLQKIILFYLSKKRFQVQFFYLSLQCSRIVSHTLQMIFNFLNRFYAKKVSIDF